MNKAQACSSQISNALFRADAVEASAALCSLAKYLVEFWHVFLRRCWRISRGMFNVFGVAAAACYEIWTQPIRECTLVTYWRCVWLTLSQGKKHNNNRDKLIVAVCSCRELYISLPQRQEWKGSCLEENPWGGQRLQSKLWCLDVIHCTDGPKTRQIKTKSSQREDWCVSQKGNTPRVKWSTYDTISDASTASGLNKAQVTEPN